MKLKPCPFCGANARYGETEQGGHYIECAKCKACTTLMFPDKCDVADLLAERWNERAPAATPAGEADVEAIRADYRKSMPDDDVPTVEQIVTAFSDTVFWNYMQEWPGDANKDPEYPLQVIERPGDEDGREVWLRWEGGEAQVHVATMRPATPTEDAESKTTDADVTFIANLPVYVPVLLWELRVARADAARLAGDVARLQGERDAALRCSGTAGLRLCEAGGIIGRLVGALDGFLGDTDLPEDDRPGVLAIQAAMRWTGDSLAPREASEPGKGA